MARQNRYEKRPLDGFTARGFSAAYDQDRARAEKELAGTMAGPKDSCTEGANGKNHDTEPRARAGQTAHPNLVAIGGRAAHDVVR